MQTDTAAHQNKHTHNHINKHTQTHTHTHNDLYLARSRQFQFLMLQILPNIRHTHPEERNTPFAPHYFYHHILDRPVSVAFATLIQDRDAPHDRQYVCSLSVSL